MRLFYPELVRASVSSPTGVKSWLKFFKNVLKTF